MSIVKTEKPKRQGELVFIKGKNGCAVWVGSSFQTIDGVVNFEDVEKYILHSDYLKFFGHDFNADWDLIERFERQLDPKQSEHDNEFLVKRKTPPRLYELVHIYGIKGVAAWFGSSFQHEGGFTPWEDVEKYVRYSDYLNHFGSPDVDWDLLDEYERHRDEHRQANKEKVSEDDEPTSDGHSNLRATGKTTITVKIDISESCL